MNRFNTLIFSSIFLLVLAGCQAEYTASYTETEYVHDYDDEPITRPEPKPEPVYLGNFSVIDSYGYDSYFFPFADLSISPFINNGLFNIHWDLDAYQDYYLELTISKSPSFIESQLIYTDFCDVYGGCHQFQELQCEFSPHLDLNCGNRLGEYQDNYIGDWFTQFPQDLYLKLEVCDEDFYYCEYATQKVQFE